MISYKGENNIKDILKLKNDLMSNKKVIKAILLVEHIPLINHKKVIQLVFLLKVLPI